MNRLLGVALIAILVPAAGISAPSREAFFPAWSPDGTKIYFYTDRHGDNREVYVMASDGSGPANLTDHPARDGVLAISAKSGAVAWYSERDGNGEIYSMRGDGTEPVNMTGHPARDRWPAWSPDGTRLVFSSDRGREDGTDAVNLTNGRSQDLEPTWSPDGTKIAFVSVDEDSWQLYTMTPTGADRTRLTPSFASMSEKSGRRLHQPRMRAAGSLRIVRWETVSPVGVLSLHCPFDSSSFSTVPRIPPR